MCAVGLTDVAYLNFFTTVKIQPQLSCFKVVIHDNIDESEHLVSSIEAIRLILELNLYLGYL